MLKRPKSYAMIETLDPKKPEEEYLERWRIYSMPSGLDLQSNAKQSVRIFRESKHSFLGIRIQELDQDGNPSGDDVSYCSRVVSNSNYCITGYDVTPMWLLSLYKLGLIDKAKFEFNMKAREDFDRKRIASRILADFKGGIEKVGIVLNKKQTAQLDKYVASETSKAVLPTDVSE